jgi:hypothetical protein
MIGRVGCSKSCEVWRFPGLPDEFNLQVNKMVKETEVVAHQLIMSNHLFAHDPPQINHSCANPHTPSYPKSNV